MRDIQIGRRNIFTKKKQRVGTIKHRKKCVTK